MAAPKKQAPAPRPKWVNRIVAHAEVDPRSLVEHPENWRKHPPIQQEALRGALDDIGWIQQIVVNQRTGRMIDGHLRVALAIHHGEASIPVSYVDLDEREERLALASLDPIAALAGADAEQLARLLQQVSTSNSGLQQMLEGLAVEYKVIPPEPGGTANGRVGGIASGATNDETFNTNPVNAPGSQIHMVQLFLTEDTYPDFKQCVDTLGQEYGLETMTDVIIAVVQRAAEALQTPS